MQAKLKSDETRLVTLSMIGTPILVGTLCILLSMILNHIVG